MSKFALFLALVLATSACSSSEQAEETARQERREAEMRRLKEEQEKADEAAKLQKEQSRPEEPPTPSEPEYREVTTYYFTSLTEKTAIACDSEPEETGCGIKLTDCSGSDYYCQTNVKVFTKTKKELITE